MSSSANLMLFQCARHGDADGLVALLDSGASPNWRNPVATGWTAVHAAVWQSSYVPASKMPGAGAPTLSCASTCARDGVTRN